MTPAGVRAFLILYEQAQWAVSCRKGRAWIFGSSGRSKAPNFVFYGCSLLWVYPTYLFWLMPVSFNTLWSFHIAFLFGNPLMWFLFLKALMNPGLLPQTYFIGFLSTMCLHSLMGIRLCWDWFKVMGHNSFIGVGFLFLCFTVVIALIMTSMCEVTVNTS
ncbi:LOW QUALITY PROTEIN: uncharacterized protein M6G45_004817 [Spheniscus humboldti]